MSAPKCGCGRDYLTVAWGEGHECPNPVSDMHPSAAMRLPYRDLICGKPTPGSDLERIVYAVADAFGVAPGDIVVHDRRGPVVVARRAVVYLARRLTPLSLPRLGDQLGGRDHSTILHNEQAAAEAMANDAGFAETVDALEVQFTRRAA